MDTATCFERPGGKILVSSQTPREDSVSLHTAATFVVTIARVRKNSTIQKRLDLQTNGAGPPERSCFIGQKKKSSDTIVLIRSLETVQKRKPDGGKNTHDEWRFEGVCDPQTNGTFEKTNGEKRGKKGVIWSASSGKEKLERERERERQRERERNFDSRHVNCSSSGHSLNAFE